MTVSVFATMFLFSLAGLSTGLLQTEGAARQRNYALAGAEAGLDFARLQLNKSLADGIDTDIAPQAGEKSKDYGVPVEYLPQVGNRCKVMLRLTRITQDELGSLAEQGFTAIPPGSNLFLNEANSDDWSRNAISDWEQAPNGGYAWKVEVTSYCGIFATTIRSFLIAENSNSSGGLSYSSRDNTGLVGDKAISLNSQSALKIKSPGNELDPDDQIADSENGTPKSFNSAIRTNGKLTLGDTTSIFGDVVISSDTGSLTGSPSSRVYGRVTAPTSAVSQDSTPWNPGYVAYPTDSIRAIADLLPSISGAGRTGDNMNPVQPAAQGSDLGAPQTPYPMTVPSNITTLPSFPTNPDATSTTVQSGVSYATSNLDSDGATGPLIFDDASGSPTKVFVLDDPNSTSSTAVNLSSRWITNNGSASDLQLYYAGSKPISIQLDSGGSGNAKISISIYAPNADISFSGKGDFTGALVGKNINMTHDGTVQLDSEAAKSLTKQSNSSTPGNTESAGVPKPLHYTVLSWQQITGALVPSD
ncbi:hypothetical protein KF728_04695 [Candidatus Obscuribacterales bacterium]|nr:hypothetical protein [Candidatus Obscuribacterales bacterium]